MSTDIKLSRNDGLLAGLTGGVLVVGNICLILMFTIGRGWGTVNDAANGVAAVLSALLAWRLRRAAPERRGRWGLAAAGAAIAVVGSALVMSRRTGWFLAGLWTSLGYALLGMWLWQAAAALTQHLPRRMAAFGRLTGAFMALGVLAIPGLLAGVDAAETAPWWAHAGFAGGLGWVLLYPIWCLWLARALLRAGARQPAAAPGL
jgi:hypothetical protein